MKVSGKEFFTLTLDLPPIPRLGRRAIISIFLIAFAARLVTIATAGFSSVDFGDARAYLFAARTLAETGHYPLRTDAFFFRAPGYPVFLLLCTLGHPDRIPMAKVANAAVGASSALLLALLSARIFRRSAVAFATGVAASLHPAFLLVARDIQSESLFLLLLLGSGFFLLAAADRPSTWLALVAGALLALAALTRPSALALSPLLAGPFLDRRYPARARAHIVGAAAFGFVLALTPWTLRNALLFHELIPVSDSLGSTFFDGNSTWADRYYQLRTRSEYDAWLEAMDRDKVRRLAALDPEGRLPPGTRSHALLSAALEERRADPAATVRLLLHKSWQWLRPYPTVWFRPRPVVAAVGLYYTGLFALTIVGFLGAHRRGAAVFCLGVLLLATATHVAILPAWRYRVPYWDPVLLLYAVWGAARLTGSASAPAAA